MNERILSRRETKATDATATDACGTPGIPQISQARAQQGALVCLNKCVISAKHLLITILGAHSAFLSVGKVTVKSEYTGHSGIEWPLICHKNQKKLTRVSKDMATLTCLFWEP